MCLNSIKTLFYNHQKQFQVRNNLVFRKPGVIAYSYILTIPNARDLAHLYLVGLINCVIKQIKNQIFPNREIGQRLLWNFFLFFF